MSVRPADTSPEAAAIQAAAYQFAGPEGRLQMALEMSEAAARLLEAGVRARYPAYSAAEVRMAAIRLRLGDDLYQAVYPHAQVEP